MPWPTGRKISPIQAAPTIKKAVPWKAVKMRKTKKDARFGASAVPTEKPKNITEAQIEVWIKHVRLCFHWGIWHRKSCTVLRPYTCPIGPQNTGLNPMNTRYRAFVKLIIEPFVLKVAATSGTADKTAVEEIGARNPQKDNTAVITIFLRCENLS